MASKVPPRAQQSKQARKAKVRAHERNLAPPFQKQQKPRQSLAERFRGAR